MKTTKTAIDHRTIDTETPDVHIRGLVHDEALAEALSPTPEHQLPHWKRFLRPTEGSTQLHLAVQEAARVLMPSVKAALYAGISMEEIDNALSVLLAEKALVAAKIEEL